VTKGQEIPPELVEFALASGVPVLRSSLKTAEFYRRIKPVVEEATAPRTTLHGSLADVYGVGLLFLGRSGIARASASSTWSSGVTGWWLTTSCRSPVAATC